MPPTLLSVEGATKRFGDVIALHEIDLRINEGDIIGLVGSNGAGKTTLLRLLSGVYRPTSGRVMLNDGADVEQARQRLGV
ncbi:MAG: ATP-binding cassette domain-containing protein, partial [Candidatus Poseidoniales archaeon]